MRTRTGMLVAAACLMTTPACALDDGSEGVLVSDDPSLGSAHSEVIDIFCRDFKSECTDAGTVQLVIDCKAPQITDYRSPLVTFSGSSH